MNRSTTANQRKQITDGEQETEQHRTAGKDVGTKHDFWMRVIQ